MRIAGHVNDGEAASIYVEMTRVAERDLIDRPAELAARLEIIRSLAEAPGTRAGAQRTAFGGDTDTAQAGIAATAPRRLAARASGALEAGRRG